MLLEIALASSYLVTLAASIHFPSIIIGNIILIFLCRKVQNIYYTSVND
jgi:hypothetical protein